MSDKNKILYPAQLGLRNYGILQIHVINAINSHPIENASVQIFRKESMDGVVDILTTDISGKTTEIELISPPIEYSLEPSQYLPYTEYIIMIAAEGFRSVMIDSAQVLPAVKSIQPVHMLPAEGRSNLEIITIDPNYLIGTYTPKVYEAEIKDMPPGEESKPVVIPEYVRVHTSVPSNIAAANYNPRYVSYIKNVVSSVTYATWPQETLNAVIYAVLSFALNRVYTNWYPRMGYDFDITSTAAFDQKWLNGRNIYTNISQAVDRIFNNYLSRPDILQPILTQLCRGELAACPGMLSLWESKLLGDRGDSAIEILHYFLGDTIYINSSDLIIGVEMLWPGIDLSTGASGEAVVHIQNQLRTIAAIYRAIPLSEDDGNYGEATKAAVSEFQNIFNLPITGITDKATWYKISRVNNELTR